ncbi:molybdopterin synthase sulfur carrier subunit [Campylobacter sp. MIT 99-7217]|uniref:MoaD/ThiS family protein n=1 Tax=Campylobacter sp. MIT 99-7217 TaxID=535091 RepID=UPI001159D7D0|nr:MoaD/ThiS family protein [Campylobacter sp. MIT 99-7217]TQR30346.1 molybdopterin synthase sulfur carrier subunit [Campylobacter sp. MIT 99-7217]
MVEVEFLGPINHEKMELEAKNLKELKKILQEKQELKEWLDLCAVAVNDTLINDLEYELKKGDKIKLLPPVSGG